MYFFHFPTQSKLRFSIIAIVTCLAIIISTGCGSPNGLPGVTQPSAANLAASASSTAKILLFNGTGTTATDVAAVEDLLTSLKLAYKTANSSQMDGLTQAQLETYKLLIVPGGNSITIGHNLSKSATNNIHNAVVTGGLHYLGVCAGSFFGGYSIYNGLNLTSGVWFNLYPNSGKGTGKTAVEISYPSGTKLDQYWQDGPQLNGWGKVVGKYPSGAPAIVEGASGKGWVLLSGIHAEAPANWRTGMTFTTSVAVDNQYFETMVVAAMNGTSLAHY